MKNQDYWRGYMAALEDMEQRIFQKHAQGKGDIMQDCKALALIETALENAPKEIEDSWVGRLWEGKIDETRSG